MSRLDVKPEPTPHKDHANIEGYIGEKSFDRLRAIELAIYSSLIIRQE
jgi:hypothetical protein